jgi:hypothetical protein
MNLKIWVNTAGSGDVNSKQFKFTLLDSSRGLHISESTVSISYTFRQQSSDELGIGEGNTDSSVGLCKRQQVI